MPSFSIRSRERLGECHPDLQTVMFTAIEDSPIDFGVSCGHRGKEEQDAAFNGRPQRSKLPWDKSKHNKIPSLAADIVTYIDGLDVYTWEKHQKRSGMPDKEIADRVKLSFHTAANHILATAGDLQVNLRWGGDFNMDGDKTTNDAWDMPHFELVED